MSTNTHSPIKLTEVYTDMEAAMIVAALEEHGINAFLTGEFTSGFRAEAPGRVTIQVRRSDLNRARGILIKSKHANSLSDSEESLEDTPSPSEKYWGIIALVVTIATMCCNLFIY